MSALTLSNWPSSVSASEVRMGSAPARMAASIGFLSTREILPTRPYLSLSR